MNSDLKKKILYILDKHNGTGYYDLKSFIVIWGNDNEIHEALDFLSSDELIRPDNNAKLYFAKRPGGIQRHWDLDVKYMITPMGRQTVVNYKVLDLNEQIYKKTKINTIWVIIGSIASILGLIATLIITLINKN